MRKLLIWDGDNTLWDGTKLDGDEITVSVERHYQVHELMKRGVLQAVASRNLEGDIHSILHQFDLDDAMLDVQGGLDRSKPDMVQSVVRALNLARHSDVVFVDDNPSHREEVERAFTGIVTADPSKVKQVIDRYFTKPEYTDEDRQRVRRYKSEQARRTAEEGYSGDRVDFLRDCNITLRVRMAGQDDMARVIDLTERANQYSARDFGVSLEKARQRGELYVGEAEDRFGSYGLSAVAVMGSNGWISLLVVSCRMAGKGLGSAFLGELIALSFEGASRTVTVSWRPSNYNGGVDALLEWYKFKIGTGAVRKMAILDIEDWNADLRPGWVAVERAVTA